MEKKTTFSLATFDQHLTHAFHLPRYEIAQP